MKHIKFLIICLTLLSNFIASSQDKTPPAPPIPDTVSFGIGYGIDYGGIGGNILFYPHRNLGLFGGVGYTQAGIAYNGGIKFRAVTKKHSSKLVPFLIGMYGLNAGVAVENGEQYNKLFYGATFGIGTDLKRKPSKHSFFTFAFLFPIYDTKIDEYIQDLRSNHGLQLKKNTMEPIMFSVGFRFIIR